MSALIRDNLRDRYLQNRIYSEFAQGKACHDIWRMKAVPMDPDVVMEMLRRRDPAGLDQ